MNDRASVNDRVLVIGDGPTGLSAALLLAKTGFDVQVLGGDESPVHKAHLNNYLGQHGTPGPDFASGAREHAERYGARLLTATVERVEVGEPFRAVTDQGTHEADWLVLAMGFDDDLVETLGVETTDEGVRVDHNGRTSRERVYAGGAVVRGTKSQVAASVGYGAAIAIDILSRVRGKPSHDYDVMPARGKETRARAG